MKGGKDVRIFTATVKVVLALALIAALIIIFAADMLSLSPNTSPFQPGDTSDPPENQNPDNHPGNNGNKPSDSPSTEIPDESIPNWSIKSTVVKNTLTDQKGNILCESRYSYPYVTSNDGSDISAFSEALSNIATDVRSYVNARTELYKSGTHDDFKVPPQITGYYTINRFSSELFSISFIFSEILPDGAIRETRMNYNLDILLGSSNITLDAIMNDAISSVNKIISEKKALGELGSLYKNYEKYVESAINNIWSVESNGILFLFPAGVLAPTSSGPVEIFIKNADLSSLLSEYGKILLNITK